LSLGIFPFNVRVGNGTNYPRAMVIFKIQMFNAKHFTNPLAQNAAKQPMTKYHVQKSHGKNITSVVKNLPP